MPSRPIWVCAALLIAFALLAWSAVIGKSATGDEPLHAVSAYTSTFLGDFRVDPEDPPLWKYWAMLPHHRGELTPQLQRQHLSDPTADFLLSAVALWRSPGVDGARFIIQSRLMILLVGLGLGAILMVWGWAAAGAGGAIVATFLFCLDPNFLAHAPLVKNDVAITFALTGMCASVWSLGRRLTWWNVAATSLFCALGPAVKFSGVLLLPILALLLAARAIGADWRKKLLVGAGVWTLAAGVTYVGIWASYGFRFSPTPDGKLFDLQPQLQIAAEKVFYKHNGRYPTTAEAHPPVPVPGRVIQWASDHRLLPQAWLFGLLYTWHTALVRPAYLLGEISDTGWFWYFPLAMLFKTPLATLIALVLSLVLLWRRRAAQSGWLVACIAVPVAVYGTTALATSLNLGLRHVLPLYPFLFLLIAVALGPWVTRRRWAMLAFAVALAAETLTVHPNYLSFFNLPFRAERLALLSDSNLDWGQDLPELARWQEQHPNERLYLCYFGGADPAFYGIRYINLPSGYILGPTGQLPDKPGVIAISATKLQGLYVYPEMQDVVRKLRQRRPREVLGSSIYLFDWEGR